jgi:hypothetical protein
MTGLRHDVPVTVEAFGGGASRFRVTSRSTMATIGTNNVLP